MVSLASAFNLLLAVQGRTVQLVRKGTPDIEVTVKVAPSNYFRHLEAPSDTIIAGREFVVSKSSLDSVSYSRPKRGDRIVDDDMGTMTISEIREMFDVGGAILGYRLRTS